MRELLALIVVVILVFAPLLFFISVGLSEIKAEEQTCAAKGGVLAKTNRGWTCVKEIQ